jgi:hypothetical protein
MVVTDAAHERAADDEATQDVDAVNETTSSPSPMSARTRLVGPRRGLWTRTSSAAAVSEDVAEAVVNEDAVAANDELGEPAVEGDVATVNEDAEAANSKMRDEPAAVAEEASLREDEDVVASIVERDEPAVSEDEPRCDEAPPRDAMCVDDELAEPAASEDEPLPSWKPPRETMSRRQTTSSPSPLRRRRRLPVRTRVERQTTSSTRLPSRTRRRPVRSTTVRTVARSPALQRTMRQPGDGDVEDPGPEVQDTDPDGVAGRAGGHGRRALGRGRCRAAACVTSGFGGQPGRLRRP